MRRFTMVLAVAALVAAVAPAAHPADAAPTPTHADSVAIGSFGSQRSVIWGENTNSTTEGAVFYQRLNADGTLKGSPRFLDYGGFCIGGDPCELVEGAVAISNSPTGAFVSWVRRDARDTPRRQVRTRFEGNPDFEIGQNSVICDDKDLSSSPPLQSASAWNGQRFLEAQPCRQANGAYSGLSILTFDPVTSKESHTVFADSASAVSVAALGSGFAVAWQHVGPTGDLDVRVRRYNNLAQPVGSVFEVAKGVGDQLQPTIAASGSNYLVAWIEGAGRDVAGRIFNGGGLGAKKTLVNAAGNQNHPWLATSSNGGWHLVWADLRSGTNDVYAAHVSSAVAVSPVNGAVVAGGSGSQSAPTVSALPNGKGYVGFLDRGLAKIRDLTAASSGTGPIRTVSLAP